MDKVIYGLCAVTAAACAFLLLRSYFRSPHRLLLWSGLCFIGLTLNNVLLVLDKVVFLQLDLSTWRLLCGFLATLLLAVGLILEEEA